MVKKTRANTLLVLAAMTGLPTADLYAQAGEAVQLEEVVVTGSVINSGISSDINALPVQVLTLEQFEYTPANSVADFLHELPSLGNSGSIFQDEGGGGNSNVNLRGAGAQYTLSLVNGRRFGGESDAPDIGALPPEAIGGIEILKTGSSAIYGSDAVAGVVNIKLRDDFEGFQLTGTYGVATRDYNPPDSIADYEDVQVGQPLSGDGSNSRIGALFGTSGDRWRFTGSLSYQDYEGFARPDRELTATRDYRRLGGADQRLPFGRGAPHGIRDFSWTTGDPVQSIDIDRFSPGDVPTSADDFGVWDEDRQRLSGAEQSIAPPMTRRSGHWAASFDINDVTQLYTFGYADNRDQTFSFHEPRVEVVVVPGMPNNVLNEAGLAFVSLDPTVHGFNSVKNDTTNWQGTIGVKGGIGERWDYDLSYTNYDKEIETRGRNGISTSAAQALANSGEFNPFCYRCTSPEVFEQLTGNPTSTTTFNLQTVDAVLSGELLEYGAGTLSAAIGYQLRDGEGEFEIDEESQSFDEWFTGSLGFPIADSRRVHAYFAEVFVPLYRGNAGDFVSSAEITAAVRTEDYSDFDGATVGQGLGRIAFLDDQVILRVGYAESFRAPDIAALILPQVTNTNFTGRIFDPVRGGFLDLDVTSGGNPDLGPEEGLSTNIGIVLRPDAIPGLYFSADFWTLEIDGLIRAPDAQGILFGFETAGSVIRDPVTLYPTVDVTLQNSGTREIEGWDFALSYDMETGWGNFNFYGNASYFTKFEDSVGDFTQDFLGEYVGDLATPKFRFAGGMNWRRNAWDAGLSFHYYGSYKDRFAPLDVVRNVDEQYTTDIQVGYDFGVGNADSFFSGLRLFAGVENLFDQDPPLVVESANGWDRFFGDIVGQYVYGGARITF
ncbi:MAG: TonB-dependent receptor [Pseudomonadota bacterium]